MAEKFYETETQDFEVVQGDTLNLPFEFKDKDKKPINDIVDQEWESTLSIEDPITRDIITALIKTHNDVTPLGDGIYYYGDSFVMAGLDIDAKNKVVCVLDHDETEDLKPGIYPFYFKFILDQAYRSEFTSIRGNIIVKKRNT